MKLSKTKHALITASLASVLIVVSPFINFDPFEYLRPAVKKKFNAASYNGYTEGDGYKLTLYKRGNTSTEDDKIFYISCWEARTKSASEIEARIASGIDLADVARKDLMFIIENSIVSAFKSCPSESYQP